MLELFVAVGIGLAMILPLANPLTTVALLMGLSRGMTEAERDRQALKASIYSFAIMVVAFYVGQMVMNLFGVSITGLRIAGGLIVAFIVVHLVLVLVSGVWNNLRSMITGKYAIEVEGDRP